MNSTLDIVFLNIIFSYKDHMKCIHYFLIRDALNKDITNKDISNNNSL
jgi:hypothetical protein